MALRKKKTEKVEQKTNKNVGEGTETAQVEVIEQQPDNPFDPKTGEYVGDGK